MRGGFVLERLQGLPRGWCARVRVPPGASLFEGHFPGTPVVPGIALLVLIADLSSEHADQQMVPVRLRGVRFRAPARPGVLLDVRFEDGRFSVTGQDAVTVEGEMGLAAAAGDLPLADPGETLPAPFLPHAPPALLVTGVGEGRATACLPARSPLAHGGRVPSCVVLEAAAQGAQAAGPAEGSARGGLLVRVSEASFPAGHVLVERPFTVHVQVDGAAPPLHRFRARTAMGGGAAAVAFAVTIVDPSLLVNR
ncbi:MAG TPA: hypothetical protein VFV75_10540 [Candidatus Polarisedimenticolaceae bacterium]|nr:hypothetical protein [Candidatus Polarisedimenticolaceae bacterium]